jgi:hypothetical protein
MTSVWLTPEIAHFVVFKYFSRSYASWSSPEHLHSAALPCALPRSPALPRALPHSSGPLSHTSPGVPLDSPIHLIPLSFLVTTYTLVPGPLGLLVYKSHVTTLLRKEEESSSFSPCISDLSELSVALPLYSRPRRTRARP